MEERYRLSELLPFPLPSHFACWFLISCWSAVLTLYCILWYDYGTSSGMGPTTLINWTIVAISAQIILFLIPTLAAMISDWLILQSEYHADRGCPYLIFILTIIIVIVLTVGARIFWSVVWSVLGILEFLQVPIKYDEVPYLVAAVVLGIEVLFATFIIFLTLRSFVRSFIKCCCEPR